MNNKDFLRKVDLLREIIKRKNAIGIIISSFTNLCWLGIKRPNVLSLTESAVVKIVVTLDDIFLVANNIEIDRILNEEIHEEIKHFFVKKTFKWYLNDEMLFKYEKEYYINDALIENEIRPYRMILTENDIEESICLGKDIVSIIESTLGYIKKGKTETDISAEMHKMCVQKNIEVGLALCAADKRALQYRHPIPTNNIIEDTCLLALTVRRHGIYSCISRMATLTKPSDELIRKRDAVLAVDCACQKYTTVGSNLREVFNIIKDTYKNNGFGAEWEEHHQGGITGYKAREEKIHQNSDIIIEDNMIFAYNPSVAGYKTEDTFYLSNGKPRITTFSEKLPLVEIEFEGKTYLKPDIIRLDQ